MYRVRNTRIPLRRTLQVRVGLLVTGAVLLVALDFLLLGLTPMARRIAEAQFTVAAGRVDARLDALLHPAEEVLRMSRGWLSERLPDLDHPGDFNRLFQPLLEALPQARSVVAGTSDGQGWMLLQLPDGSWRNRFTDIPRWGARHRFFERDVQGNVREHWQALDYDPRTRAWYRAAGNDGGRVHWSAPYTFYTTGDPGITGSTRLSLPDGHELVVGIDLMLRDISAATMGARISSRGMAVVLSGDRRIVALPAPPAGQEGEEWLSRVLDPAESLGIGALDGALAAWDGGGSARTFGYRTAGEMWLARVQPHCLGNQMLWVLTLAPAADFAPDWLPVAGVLAGGITLLLLAGALLAQRQAERVARPLEALATASERIGRLDFGGEVPAATGVEEVDRLAAAHENMRALLQGNQARIAAQEAELREQIEALRAAEDRLRDSEGYNKVLFSASRIPLVVLDPASGRFIDCNQAAADIYRLDGPEAVAGLTPLDVSPPLQPDGSRSDAAATEALALALGQGAHVLEWRHRRPDGEEWDAEVNLMRFPHRGRVLIQFSVQDVTERKRAAQALERLAFYDTLTGLPNRALFLDRLRQAISAARRPNHPVALLFLDLDRFKEINDTQGHAVGDEVLIDVARRFRGVLRREESLARVGGDEFAVVAPDADREAATHIAQRIADALGEQVSIKGTCFSVGVSIGIALFPQDGATPGVLLRHADIAMYRAKAAGRRYQFYDPRMSSGLAERMSLARDLQGALRGPGGELSLHFQPQVDLATGMLTGAEALMRWQHPIHGHVSPCLFIPIAEERGMMSLVGDWVIGESCRQVAAWRDRGLLLPGRLAINIAAQQIEEPGFAERTTSAVRAAGLDPAQFELELTEGGMMRNLELAVEVFEALDRAGFSLAIDDFGTGYSSLAYLKRLRAGKLKVDRSFVRDMIGNGSDHAIVATIIGMGRTLGLRTLAEGAETAAQAEALLRLGCDEAQGFHFGRPEPAEVFAERWLGESPT